MKLFSANRARSKRFPSGYDSTSGPIVMLGFNKTGTTSLKHFFRENGFREIKHDNGKLPLSMIQNAASRQNVFAGYEERYSVFCDLGYFSNNFCFECNQPFKTIDRQYPKALFIYNYRPVDKWLDSRLNHRSAEPGQGEGTLLERAMKFHGVSDPGEMREIWRTERHHFEEALGRYFASRDNLLKLDIESDNVAADISRFLGFEFDPQTWKQHRKTVDLKS